MTNVGNLYICEFCWKKCKNKNSQRQHEIRCNNNPNKIYIKPKTKAFYEAMKKRRGKWANAYTKAKELGIEYKCSDETKKKLSKSLKEYNKNNPRSEEKRKKHSEAMKKAVLKNINSYTKNNVSWRVKHVKYKWITFKGTWELKTVKTLDRLNIKWSYEEIKVSYIDKDNIKHFYFPDFYLPEYNCFIEVKGLYREKDFMKKEQFKKDLFYIDKDNIDNIYDCKNKKKFFKLLKNKKDVNLFNTKNDIIKKKKN